MSVVDIAQNLERACRYCRIPQLEKKKSPKLPICHSKIR